MVDPKFCSLTENDQYESNYAYDITLSDKEINVNF